MYRAKDFEFLLKEEYDFLSAIAEEEYDRRGY